MSRPEGWWTDVASLQAEVMRLRRARCELDCCFTMGDVADLTGSHCPHDDPCQRCYYERRIEALEKERAEAQEAPPSPSKASLA